MFNSRFAEYSLLIVITCILSGSAYCGIEAAFSKAVSSYDQEKLSTIQEELDLLVSSESDKYWPNLMVAECYATRAAIYRRDRHIQKLSKREDSEKRSKQEEWARAAMPYALHALELAHNDEEKAHANRLIGELYSHQITGMITGMRNGPKAKRYIEAALALLPEDPECNRAIGIMYLHNPPISGGDIEKAIMTFKVCSSKEPKNDRYLVLLAMAYRKNEEKNLAMDTARKALAINPNNLDAKHLMEALR